MKAAFGGNSKTNVVINCRSDGDFGDETLQSMRFGERCGMISNTMRQAASSFSSTMATVDHALQVMQQQLQQLENRGKQHLPSYQNLTWSLQELQRKKRDLMFLNKQSPLLQNKNTDAPLPIRDHEELTHSHFDVI